MASSSRTSPKRDWYIWHDGGGEGDPPNTWLSEFGGTSWEFDAHTAGFYYHAFLKTQSGLNWRYPQVRRAIPDVMRFWAEARRRRLSCRRGSHRGRTAARQFWQSRQYRGSGPTAVSTIVLLNDRPGMCMTLEATDDLLAYEGEHQGQRTLIVLNLGRACASRISPRTWLHRRFA